MKTDINLFNPKQIIDPIVAAMMPDRFTKSY